MSGHEHPLFARLYTRLNKADLARGGAEHRVALLEGLSGRVIEVGCGPGPNFAFYPSTVTEVVAVEPEPYLRARAMEAAAIAPIAVTVVDGTAERLPGADGSFDAAIASLVLCSVDDQAVALREIARVLKHPGQLRFYEHVRGTGKLAKFQRAMDRTIWPRVGAGCHCSRDTEAAITDAGFVIEDIERFTFSTCPIDRIVAPHILGTATK